ncbi:MAG: hypothetical protein HYV63_04450 [Candidatus Schekmanbacteria bacterium]|nr:hypothetical protein [Candidatus Schekmanbacteria bacterium]
MLLATQLGSGPPLRAEPQHLPLILGLCGGQATVDRYDDLLTEADGVFYWGGKLSLVRPLPKAKTLVSFMSIEQIRQAREKLREARVDFVSFNPEQWRASKTPPEDYADLPAAVGRARKLTDELKTRLAFCPDNVLLEKDGERVAPLVDLFTVQLQRFQVDPAPDFRSAAARLIAMVRKGAAHVPVYAQLSMAPARWETRQRPDGTVQRIHLRAPGGRKALAPLTAAEVLAQVAQLRDLVDGLVFLCPEDNGTELRKVVLALR